MKNLLFTLVLLSFLNFTSCTENFEDIKDAINNETLTPKTVKLIGKWQLKSAVLGNGVDVTNSCFMEEVIEFKIDGTYIDRRYQINPVTNECEMAGEFIRGYNNDNEIFETAANELVIASYKIKSKNTLILNFTIPFEATVTYTRIY